MKGPVLLALGVLSGCGWHAGVGVPAGARSVAVEAARREGDVLERGLEPELTAALSQAVLDWVDLPLVSPREADLIVRGVVLEYRRRGGVRNAQNELIETAVSVSARAVLIDRRTGQPIGEPAVAQEWSGFSLDDPANEDAARARVLRHVAASLVLDLFSPPPLPDSEDGLGARGEFP